MVYYKQVVGISLSVLIGLTCCGGESPEQTGSDNQDGKSGIAGQNSSAGFGSSSSGGAGVGSGTSGSSGQPSSGAAGMGGTAGGSGTNGTGGNAGISGTSGATSGNGDGGMAGVAGTAGASGTSGTVGTGKFVALGGLHTCALLGSGNVRCWGGSDHGQLGYGNYSQIGDDETPASVGDVDVGGTVTQLSAGQTSTCALLDNGKVRCWGWGDFGQLGYPGLNSIGEDETPASVGDVHVGGNVIQISAGGTHTCALLDTGKVRCWGVSTDGQLGYGNTNNVGIFVPPADAGDVDVGGTVTQISAGYEHTCALLDTGKVRCWGKGKHGRLGYGTTNNVGDDETPASVGDVDVGGTIVQISAGSYHTCALLKAGNVRCWGSGYSGLLGYGNSNNVGDDETPASAGDVNVGGIVTQISSGGSHTCVLLTTGKVRCWGDGFFGQLGYGNTNNVGVFETPADAGDVNVGESVMQIGVGGGTHTCALLTTGNIRCWGTGNVGQLGYGNTVPVGDDETPASAGDVPME
jgi:alpha-tubulin suppressor-like RCC1 family protein